MVYTRDLQWFSFARGLQKRLAQSALRARNFLFFEFHPHFKFPIQKRTSYLERSLQDATFGFGPVKFGWIYRPNGPKVGQNLTFRLARARAGTRPRARLNTGGEMRKGPYVFLNNELRLRIFKNINCIT